MNGWLETIKNMPGTWKGINPFDALYSSIAVAMIETLGGAVKVLDTAGLGLNAHWRPGEKLRILFIAYSGARNTGAEVRVGECIRQMNQVLGPENILITQTTLDYHETSEYFKDYQAEFYEHNPVFFWDVFNLVRQNHLVVLVEGSCWKENFASALLLFFLYAAGLAGKLGKVSFSYAVDAGNMNKLNNLLSYFLSHKMDLLITRSADSTKVLEKIGLPGAVTRVDTAWTQEAETPAWAEKELKRIGWDGKTPLVGLAFQNYFWWPVVPDLARFAKSMVTGDTTNQYKMVYFYSYDKKAEAEFRRFATTLAETMDWIAETYQVQPVLIGMEALDEGACKEAAKLMKHQPLIVSCNQYVGTQMAAFLRRLKMLITTRYHAMVLSMPGVIPFIGLSRDERIRGVMKEIGLYDDYYLDYRAPNLKAELRRMTERLLGDPNETARVEDVILKNLPYYYAQMALLGLDIRQLVMRSFPGVNIKDLNEDNPEELLPHIPRASLKPAIKKKFKELKKA